MIQAKFPDNAARGIVCAIHMHEDEIRAALLEILSASSALSAIPTISQPRSATAARSSCFPRTSSWTIKVRIAIRSPSALADVKNSVI